jgi:pimeloyl-ACP methyl ester carboxylesterase
MSDLAGYFHANQMNVVNARLPGHFEKQFDALNTTHRGEWITATNSSFKIASELGEKVLLVGHSTGGLLASLMAIKNPEQVAGLVLLAPAYRLTVMSRLKAAFSSQVEIAYTEQETGRYISGPAGQQVVLLGREFWAELSKDPNLPPIDVLKAKLRHVPILMINTALDKTIDPAFNRVVMQVLSEGNRSDAKRRHLLLPETDQTLHSAITLRANTNGSEQSFTKIQESLHEFLFDHSLSKDAETRIEP